MNLKIIPFIFIVLRPIRCSKVLDKLSQQSIYVSSYCPTMKYCPEGTHVMCMYYDPKHVSGPRCNNFVNVQVTPQMVELILEKINDIRSRLSIGQEKGQDDEPLPRAYGMMRMEWDSELATFAQVLANQCLGGRQDQCRATERFSNPGQAISVINFRASPSWAYLNRNNTSNGLNDEKLKFAIDKIFKAWHGLKVYVTEDIINNGPPSLHFADYKGSNYIKLIRGSATHIGCGLSGYSRYHASDDLNQNVHNGVEMICNLSESPQAMQPVYMTNPPIPNTGFTEDCGCPKGYKESNTCLCVEDHSYELPPTSDEFESNEPRNKNNKKGAILKPRHDDSKQLMMSKLSLQTSQQSTTDTQTCDQAGFGESRLMLFPIFTIQDAPSDYSDRADRDERYEKYGRTSYSKVDNSSFLPMNSFEEIDYPEDLFTEKPKIFKFKPERKSGSALSPYLKRNVTLPRAYSDNVIKVKRRKGKQNLKGNKNSELNRENIFKKRYFKVKDDENKSASNSAEKHHKDYRQHRRQNNNASSNDIVDVVTHEENDNNLMSLLDILEQQVKRVALDGSDKEKFDAKMRKIYRAIQNKRKETRRFPKETITTIKTYPDTTDTMNSDDFEGYKELKGNLRNKISDQLYEKAANRPNRLLTKNIRNNNKLVDKKVVKLNLKTNYDNLVRKYDGNLEPRYNDDIDYRLLNIITQKTNTMNKLDNKNRYNVNNKYSAIERQPAGESDTMNIREYDDTFDPKNNDHIDHQYDNNDEHHYTNIPAPRNQETLSYKGTNLIEKRLDSYEDVVNIDADAYSDKVIKNDQNNVNRFTYKRRDSNSNVDVKRRSQEPTKKKANVNNNVVGTGRRAFSFFENPERRTQNMFHHLRKKGFNERPTRRLQLNQDDAQIRSRFQPGIDPFYLTNRATF